MPLSGSQFAILLAERLTEILPDEFAIIADEDSLWLDCPDGYGSTAWSGEVDNEDDETGDERYARAAWTVLSSVQDGVVRTIRATWPPIDGRPTTLAEPWAQVENGVLHLGYNDGQAAVVRLRPITLNE